MASVKEVIMKDIKEEVSKGLDKVNTLKDEVKLHLHLASLDAKQEWDEKLEPQVQKLDQLKNQITESSGSFLRELERKLEDSLARIRPGGRPRTA
jgi:hypothetical protein